VLSLKYPPSGIKEEFLITDSAYVNKIEREIGSFNMAIVFLLYALTACIDTIKLQKKLFASGDETSVISGNWGKH